MYSIAKPRIDQKSLKCQAQNGCTFFASNYKVLIVLVKFQNFSDVSDLFLKGDFFGNAQWDHLCSKCYREKVLKDRLVAQGTVYHRKRKHAEF